MKKLGYILIAILLLITLVSCKKDEVEEVPNSDDEVIEEPVEENTKEGLQSPLSGLYAEEEKVNRRIVGIMFDNHPKARWQAGLKDAELIYEFPVEAPYTRYLGFFLINDPEAVGPIRSARPYFVTKVAEFDAVYVRAGGSAAANQDVKDLGISDISALSSSYKIFYRIDEKKAPNNLYTSMEAIRAHQQELGFEETSLVEGFVFNDDDKDIDGFEARIISIDYNSQNNTKYIYDVDTKSYLREKDGKAHIDELDKSQLSAKNIIIQEVNSRLIPNSVSLEIDLVGEGSGKYFTNGKGINIKWMKEDRKGKTTYYTEDGQELTLNPGATWIQIVNERAEVIIDQK